MEGLLDQLRNVGVFILILGSAVTVHELGHLLASILVGVEIQEFGIGIPPRLKKIGQVRGTEITLNWIPLGGFVRPKGEYDRDAHGGFADSAPWKRLVILLTGPLVNVLMGFLILTIAFMSGGPDRRIVKVIEVIPGSPADVGGLLEGDIIVSLNRQPLQGGEWLRDAIREQAGLPVVLQVERDAKVHEIVFTPRDVVPEGEGPAGFNSMGLLSQHNFRSAAREAGRLVAKILN